MLPVTPSIKSYEEFKIHVQSDSRYIPFREIFAHEPLQRLVYHEKCLPGPIAESRVIVNPETHKITGGDSQDTSMPIDAYYPGVFLPFELKGIWLPLESGELFSTLSSIELQDCPLIRKRGHKDKILFLIHPTSEVLYAELLATHWESIITVSALSFSSIRSLLIALPNVVGGFDPVMVKVTLNQSSQGVYRVLTRRECALSVANSAILSRKLLSDSSELTSAKLPLEIFQDPLAFVPTGYTNGMLYRKLPDFLNPKLANPEGLYAMPLLALYGEKNREWLKTLVKINGGNITHFLRDYFLNPFVHVFLTLLDKHETSIEAHGQNLLFMLDSTHHIQGLLYRDMGGVNLYIDSHDVTLPTNLREPGLSYFENHDIDAAKALEDLFVGRGLFPLSKQLVKMADYFQENDADFRQWYQNCLSMEESAGIAVLKNWTKAGLTQEDHETELLQLEYCRYGYVENLFGDCFLNYLAQNRLITPELLEQMQRDLFLPEALPDGTIVAPCSNIAFFVHAIPAFLKERREQRKVAMSIFTDGTTHKL